MKPLKLLYLIIIFVFCISYFSSRASAAVSPTPTIVWSDGFENDPLGRRFTWGDDSGLYGGYAADISAGTDVNSPYSHFEVVSDTTAEGSHSLRGNLYGSTPAATSGTPRAHRFCLLISPANSYASGITDGIYISWKMKFTQWQPIYKSIKIFHLGRYTTPTQRFVLQIDRGSGSTGGLSINSLFNNGQEHNGGNGFTFNLNTWYTFEAVAHENETNGFYKLWINGNQVLDETGLNNVAGVDFGTTAWGKFTFEVGVEISAGANEVTSDVLFNIDDIKVGDIYLGGSSPSPSPSPSPSSSPSSSPTPSPTSTPPISENLLTLSPVIVVALVIVSYVAIKKRRKS
jgi:hypothetical protein